MSSFAMTAGVLGGVLSLLAYIPRVIRITRDKTDSGSAWLIWTLSNFLIFLSYYALGARTTIWVPLAYFLGSAIVTILAYINASGKWTTLHKGLLTIAILSAVRWWYFENALVALGFNVFIDFIGYVGTIKIMLRSTKKEENIISWALCFVGATLNILALTQWTISISGYPIILFIMNGIVFSLALKNYFRPQIAPVAETVTSNENPSHLP